MIRQPSNWNQVQEFTEKVKLPLGAYVCKVQNVRVDSYDGNSAQLCICFDIAEGEYTGFYKREFDTNNSENKKFKGVLRIWLPKDDGTDKDEWTKRTLKGVVTAFERSNIGYKWNWDERSLVGRMIGILFRNEEWEYEGKSGWTVRPFRAISVDSVRNGDFALPEDKPLKSKSSGGYTESYGGDYGYSSAPAPADDTFETLPDEPFEWSFR